MEDRRKKIGEIFIAENVRLHIDMPPEILAKVQSILKEITTAVEIIKISMSLPNIFEDWKAVSETLAITEYAECGKILEKCARNLKKSKFIMKCPGQSYINQDIIQVIDIFQKNWKVMEILGDEYLDMSYEDVGVLNSLTTLAEIGKQRMFKDPRAELQMEKRLHAIYRENKFLLEDIDSFQKKILRSKNNLRWRIASKEGIVASIESELRDEKKINEKIFEKEKNEANKRFKTVQTTTYSRTKEVEEDRERAQESLAKTFKTNTNTLAEVRAERNKLLIQLQTLTTRFDTNLSERFKMNLTLDKKLAELQQNFDTFVLETYTPVEEVYNGIVKAAEEERQREFERRLANFIGNRAARIIQREWKRYMKALKKERAAEKKKDKGKGKK